MHQSVSKSLQLVACAQVGQFAGMLVFGNVADKLGRRPAFSIFAIITAIAVALLAYRWEYLADNRALFWGVMLVFGFGSGCTAGFGALLAELYPTELRSMMMGTTYNLARAAQLGAPLLVAWAVARNGLAGGLTVPVVLAVLTATWVWILPETKGITLPTLKR
jgi:MFS family permease